MSEPSAAASNETGAFSTAPDSASAPMSHLNILRALSGLLMAMFVAILSSTVVSAALPQIIGDLEGGQSSYTWVITATLLAMTVSTPIWGKFADLFPRKRLIQIGIGIFVGGSILAGFSQSTGWLIGCRVIQGIGAGGITALVQVILADLVSPRERGRYSGYIGAVFGLSTVVGPLLGGLLTDTVGWRWCFFVGVPFAVAALIVLHKTLHLPHVRREGVSIDYLGAFFLSGGISSLLIWVSLAGHQYAWASWQTTALVVTGIILIIAAIITERRVREPLIPLDLFRHRTIVLTVVASIAVGLALFGATVFLSQYMQIARGKSPTESGLLTIPMAVGLFAASTIVGRIISETGRYKRWMLLGAGLLTIGLTLMGTIDETTSLVELAGFMFCIGAGVGMVMQNLVLVVQNTVRREEIGAGSSLIAFFRSMGGAIGVSVLGAVLSTRAGSLISDGLKPLGVPTEGFRGGTIPQIDKLSPDVAHIVEHAYGLAISHVFLVAAPLGLIVFIAIFFMKEVPLGTKSGIDIHQEEQAREQTNSEAISV